MLLQRGLKGDLDTELHPHRHMQECKELSSYTHTHSDFKDLTFPQREMTQAISVTYIKKNDYNEVSNMSIIPIDCLAGGGEKDSGD